MCQRLHIYDIFTLITDGFSNITFFKDEQSLKADDSSVSTDDGIVILINDEQSSKAQMSMYFTREGIEISFNEEHLLKS